MMSPPIAATIADVTDCELGWRHALESLLADLDAERFDLVTPNRLPVHLGDVPDSLGELAATVVRLMDSAASAVRDQMNGIDSELRTSASRGARRWAVATPVPSQLDCSA